MPDRLRQLPIPSGCRSTGAGICTGSSSPAPRSTTPRSARASRSSSSTASPAAGRTGSRTSPTSAHGHRAIALDLPGFGASPMPSWPIDMPAYGRLLHDFCEKLDLGSGATLVGNSMGGLGRRRGGARRDPSALRARWSSSPPPGSSTPGARRSGRRRPPAPGEPSGRRSRPRRTLDRHPPARPALPLAPLRPLPEPAAARAALGADGGGLQGAGFADALRAVIGYDIRDRLGEIEIADADRLGL